MIVRSTDPYSFVVEFPFGPPDGNISWRVLDESETQLATGTVTPDVDATSSVITVIGTYNTLTVGDFVGYRDLTWSYTVDSVAYNGETRYNLEARVPFGASVDGVRSKLGVDAVDVPDADVSLAQAYLQFQYQVGAVELAAASDGALWDLKIKDAIEALAAIALIPGMKTRIALKESSGTNTYQRDKVDWMEVRGELYSIVSEGLYAVDPSFDPTFNFGALFLLAPPATDAITGA